MAAPAADFETLIPHAKRAGFVATGLAAAITSMFGWELGENLIAQIAMAGLLALCTFIVGYSLVFAWHAYKRGLHSVGHAAVALFIIAVTVEFLSHTGFTAANRDATVQQASFQATAYDDTRANVKDAEARLQRLRDERNVMKPVNPPASAKAVIASAEAHKFWGTTEGCKTTKGPKTREFCDRYNSAIADLALWDQIAAQETKITAAELAVADARKTASTSTVGHAAGASQSLILASMATGNVEPDAQAQFWSGVGISALLALFAIAAGGLLNFIAYAFESAAPRVSHETYRASPLKPVQPQVVHTVERIDDRSALEAMRAALAGFQARAA